MIRLNHHSRSFEEVPQPLLSFSHIEQDRFTIPAFATLMSYRVIVGTIREIDELNLLKCNNASLQQFERFTMSALYPGKGHDNTPPHFTHLFVDEAAQATEPE